MQTERREKLTLVFKLGCLKNYCECYEAKIPCTVTNFYLTSHQYPFNSLQNLISSFSHTFSNNLSFRTTANALGARTWIPEEEEAKCQAAAKEETQPTP